MSDLNRIIIGLVVTACVVYLLVTTKDYSNFYSLFGLAIFVIIAIFLSKNPSKVIKIKYSQY